MKKIRNYKLLLLTPLFLVFLLITLPFPVFAQLGSNSLSIGYSPMAVYLKLNPGDTKEGTLTFWNLAPSQIKYKVYTKGFKQIQEIPGTSRILTDFEESQDPYSASKWVTVEKKFVDLVPSEYTEIKYKLVVPKDAASGEYHVEVFLVSEIAEKKLGPSSAALADLGAGPAMLIQVGEKQEKAEIEYFTTDKKFYEYTPTIFETRYINKGNTHITPTGDIVIKNFLGQEVDRIAFNSNQQSLLRGNSALYRDTWKMDNPFMKNGKLSIGPLKATLISTYKSENPGFAPLSAVTSYWVLPWKIILAVIITITIIIRTFTKLRKKDKIVKSKKEEIYDQPQEYEKYWAKVK